MRIRAGWFVPCVCFVDLLAAQHPAIRDSAGIRLITEAAVANLPVRFTLATKPDIVIGGLRDNPADELNPRIGYPAAVRLPGNRILVADRDHWTIFDASGKNIGQLGRSGAGPGEFRDAQNGCRFRGDSLLLWDVGNRRISIWGPSGKLAREYTPPGFAWASSCLQDGSILVQGTVSPSLREDVPLATYQVVATDGSVRGTTSPLPTMFYSGSMMREVDIRGHGDRFLFAPRIELGAIVLDRSGKVVAAERTLDIPVPVTDANLAQYSMSCTPNRATKVCTPSPTKAKSWPAYYGFAVGEDGRRWYRLNHGGSDSVWVAIDSTGRALGKLVLPPAPIKNRRILQFGRDDVLISDFDADGARRILSYRIVPFVAP